MLYASGLGEAGAGVPGASNGTPNSSSLEKALAKSAANFSSSLAYSRTYGLNFLSQISAISECKESSSVCEQNAWNKMGGGGHGAEVNCKRINVTAHLSMCMLQNLEPRRYLLQGVQVSVKSWAFICEPEAKMSLKVSLKIRDLPQLERHSRGRKTDITCRKHHELFGLVFVLQWSSPLLLCPADQSVGLKLCYLKIDVSLTYSRFQPTSPSIFSSKTT